MSFASHSKSSLQVAVDIASDSIRGLVFQSSNNDSPPHAIKKMIYFLPRTTSEEKVAGKLHEFIFSAVKASGKIPEKIIVGIGPHFGKQEWAEWKTGNLDFRRIPYQGLSDYFSNLSKTNRIVGQELLAYPMDVSVNGYALSTAVSSPEIFLRQNNARIRQLGFNSLLISLPSRVSETLFYTQKSLGGMPIELVPTSAALHTVITKILSFPDSLLIFMGGKTTSLLLIKEGITVNYTSSPHGTQELVRNLAKLLSVSLEEAKDLRQQYIQGMVHGEVLAKLKDFFAKETAAWQKDFVEALDFFYTSGPLSSTVVLAGESAILPEITASIQNGSWLNNLSYAKTSEVRILEAGNVFEGETLGGALQGAEDTALAALIYYSIHHKSLF